MSNDNSSIDAMIEPEPTKYFFQERFAKLGVKGNFMPLAAQPKHVDLGDWLAHQGKLASQFLTPKRNTKGFVAHEQYRVLDQVLGCIQEVDTKTGVPLCNQQSCPVMSAGRSVHCLFLLRYLTD